MWSQKHHALFAKLLRYVLCILCVFNLNSFTPFPSKVINKGPNFIFRFISVNSPRWSVFDSRRSHADQGHFKWSQSAHHPRLHEYSNWRKNGTFINLLLAGDYLNTNYHSRKYLIIWNIKFNSRFRVSSLEANVLVVEMRQLLYIGIPFYNFTIIIHAWH